MSGPDPVFLSDADTDAFMELWIDRAGKINEHDGAPEEGLASANEVVLACLQVTEP